MKNILLSAKGGDITVWRAATDFATAYRQALLDLAASDHDSSSETVFQKTCTLLETATQDHNNLLEHLNGQIREMATAPPHCRKEVTITFYNYLYRHFSHFRSVPIFYELSMAFLQQASAAIIAQARIQLGDSASALPEFALIAVGPAGRHEYSPFCALQLLIVHDNTGTEGLRAIGLFSEKLHDGFEAAGLAPDQEVTPRNPEWRGTLAEWRLRCEAEEEHINPCRLADQFSLYSGNHLGDDLKQISCATLRANSSAVTNLVHRMTALSNGLGIMGRLKLEYGLFKLLDYGLLPFSASLSTLSLIKGSSSVSSSGRIYDLLMQQVLDVELAERMLATWHDLHNLRLGLEQFFEIDRKNDQLLHLNPNELSPEQRQSLKEALESVAIIQRHVEIIFSEMGNSAP
ncbi:MAG: hypothetical protein A2076_16995 [Geobacteraceae bacterium GWC2_53_11]|nr:MAG: hypothetical protein A2076_16995 [Geobacteraceae bacterium GWC2_53_11]